MKKLGWNYSEKIDGANFKNQIVAAGGVLYRPTASGELEVAVVHRTRYDDWSLPKGKRDKGETLPVTAAREIAEETGFAAVLGQFLGATQYSLKGGVRKQVSYWAARAGAGEFVPNDECDELRWLPVKKATKLVSYDLDEQLLERFDALVAPTVLRARQVLLVRHARAGDRTEWSGNDLLRPLDKKGRYQAEFLSPMLRAFGASAVVSAEPDRCTQTVAPLAEELGVEVVVDERVGDIAADADPVAAADAVRALVSPEIEDVTVVSSQGSAIPELLGVLAEGTLLAGQDFDTKKAGVWVLTFVDQQFVAADYLPSPLPVI